MHQVRPTTFAILAGLMVWLAAPSVGAEVAPPLLPKSVLRVQPSAEAGKTQPSSLMALPIPRAYPGYNVNPYNANRHRNYGYNKRFDVPTFRWGYFGVQPRQTRTYHTGYYHEFRQWMWSYR